MEILIKIVQVLASFSILVLIHEFGHFIFAKIFGARVDKFYLFFDPWFSIFKFKIGETQYGMGWVPFGGYCKIAGMVDESMDTDQLATEPQPWEYRSKPAWQRMLIIVGGVMMNIILAIGIYIGITYHWGDEYIKNEDVHNGFAYSELAQKIGFRNGDKILLVGGQQMESYRQIPATIILDAVEQVEIERNGQPMSVSIDPKYLKELLHDKNFLELRFPFVVAGVVPDGNASRAGVMAGDSLTGVDSLSMSYFDEFRAAFAQNKGDSITLQLVRSGQPISLNMAVTPEGMIGAEASTNFPQLYNISTRKYGFWEAIPVGFERTFTSIGSYLKQLKLIASPETEAYKSVGGIIAMGKIFPAEWNWLSFWQVTALLSIMLAVLNILPIPMLDGGHLVFILYEMITRRAPSQKFMESAQTVGMVIVFGIIILANGNDILKLIFS